MIPKIIHYCWFGRNPKPKLAKKCLRSWKKYCKDFTIIEWNEDNFDLSTAPLYVQQAYATGKWAFVTDYVRLWAMVTYGGVYMDTDVELIRSIDNFLIHDAFSGFENPTCIPTGIMACKKDFPLFQEFLDFYKDASFFNNDGSINTTTNVTTMTNIVLSYGLKQNNQYQVVSGFALYPNDVFCPVDYTSGRLHLTERTAAIHWFSGSWHTNEQQKRRRKRIRKQKVNDCIDYIIHLPNRILRTILGNSRYTSLKAKLKQKR